MKQWLSRMKLAHKMVLGFLGLIALPFTLLSVFSFASVASHYVNISWRRMGNIC